MNERNTTNTQWTPRGELNVPKTEHDQIIRIYVHMSQLVTAEAGVVAKRRGWSMSKVIQEAVEHYLRCGVPGSERFSSLTIPACTEEDSQNP